MAAWSTTLNKPPDLVVGDLNMTEKLPNYRSPSRQLRICLEALGLHSSWHTVSGEQFGSESQITYTHYATHIDYCFVSKRLRVADCFVPNTNDLFAGIPNGTPLDHYPVVCDLACVNEV